MPVIRVKTELRRCQARAYRFEKDTRSAQGGSIEESKLDKLEDSPKQTEQSIVSAPLGSRTELT